MTHVSVHQNRELSAASASGLEVLDDWELREMANLTRRLSIIEVAKERVGL